MAGYSAEICGQCLDIGGNGLSTGTELAAGGYGLSLGLHCNVADTYRIYGVDGTTYQKLYLPQGGPYPYLSTKITDNAGSAVDDGDVCVALP